MDRKQDRNEAKVFVTQPQKSANAAPLALIALAIALLLTGGWFVWKGVSQPAANPPSVASVAKAPAVIDKKSEPQNSAAPAAKEKPPAAAATKEKPAVVEKAPDASVPKAPPVVRPLATIPWKRMAIAPEEVALAPAEVPWKREPGIVTPVFVEKAELPWNLFVGR